MNYNNKYKETINLLDELIICQKNNNLKRDSEIIKKLNDNFYDLQDENNEQYINNINSLVYRDSQSFEDMVFSIKTSSKANFLKIIKNPEKFDISDNELEELKETFDLY